MISLKQWVSWTILVLLIGVRCGFADGPADNHPDQVRRVPRLGIELTKEQTAELQTGLAELERKVKHLRASAAKTPLVAKLLPDVLIYHRAVKVSLEHQEFFAAGDVKAANELLAEGIERADQLLAGKADWTTQTGLVVRGFVSRLDKTVQPYGLVIPENYVAGQRVRLDVWFHGRGETLSEVKFLQGRRKQKGVFSPANTIVLHPYGRYSNANKFAGEIDVLEAIADVQQRYTIDQNRIAVRGFSMGGASTWQLAVHYPSRWVAANPGAGFSETPEFLMSFQAETLKPTWWEQKLWHWYDCNDWAVNLAQCPTVAYSGEVDRQKQAADVMEEALKAQGISLVHEIGPNTGHKYHPVSRDRVDAKIAQIAARGRRRLPRTIHFATYTLRYNHCAWLTIDRLGEHWEQARVDGSLTADGIRLRTKNVTQLTLELPTGTAPFDPVAPVRVRINGQQVTGELVSSDRSWTSTFHFQEGVWSHVSSAPANGDSGLQKKHLLQGPIDDAFMDAFLFVAPTGKSSQPQVDKWSRGELARAVEHWRRHFRGDAIVKDDTKVTDDDLRSHHIVLWGDYESNSLLQRIAPSLPIRWTDDGIQVRRKEAIRPGPPRAGDGLPQSAESRTLCSAKQFVHVSRIRVPQQRPPSPHAARLGRGGPSRATGHAMARADCRRWIF